MRYYDHLCVYEDDPAERERTNKQKRKRSPEAGEGRWVQVAGIKLAGESGLNDSASVTEKEGGPGQVTRKKAGGRNCSQRGIPENPWQIANNYNFM